MNSEVVHSVILRVFNSPVASDQQQAMKELQQFEDIAGYCPALLIILQAYGNAAVLNINEAILCVICLKNLVNRRWMQARGLAAPVLSTDDKAGLKLWLCQWLSSHSEHSFYDKRVSTHVHLIIRRVARYDWPSQWPELLPLLYNHITSTVSGTDTSRPRARCLSSLDHILRELSSKRLSTAKKLFTDISTQLFKDLFGAFKVELLAALQLLFEVCQEAPDRLRACFGALERCCLLADVLYQLIHSGMTPEWLVVHRSALREYLGLIMHVFSPTAPASVQLLPMLRHLSRMHQSSVESGADADLGVGAELSVCLFAAYDEQASESLVEELGKLSEAVAQGQATNMLSAVYMGAAMLSSQLLGEFPSVSRQHMRQEAVQEAVVQFGQFYHSLLQTELVGWAEGSEALPGLPCSSAAPLTPLSRSIAHTCVLFESHILACGEYHAKNPRLGAAILELCCSESMALQYTDWCCRVLLSKTSSGAFAGDGDGTGSLLSDLELWRTEPEELYQAQESLTERDALRIAAEGLFLAVLEARPDVVSGYCIMNNPLLSIAQPTTLPALLNQYSLSAAQLGSAVAVNMHNNLVQYADNLLLCLGLGMYHFAHIETNAETTVGALLYQNMLLPTLSCLVESPDTGAFDVVAGGKLVARLPLLPVRLCWLVTCSLYTISNDFAVVAGLVELSCCLLASIGGRVDVVLAMQVCDTISNVLQNAGSGPGGTVYELLLAELHPRRDPNSSCSYLAYVVSALSHLLLHPELLSGEQDNYYETHTKIIALLTELVAHYDMATLGRLGMDGVYYSLLSAYVQLWTTHVSQAMSGAAVAFSPAYPTAIVDSIGQLLLAINNNIGEQLRLAGDNASEFIRSAAVTSFVSLYPSVVGIINAAVGGKLDRQLQPQTADGDCPEEDECLDICRLEGLVLWGAVLRSCPPVLSQLTVGAGADATTLDSLLLRLLAVQYAPLFTSEMMQSGSTDMPKALMLVLEGYIIRYAPYCVDEMVTALSAGPGAQSVAQNSREEMARVFNTVLEVVAGKTIGSCSPRAVGIIMRPWVAVLGVSHPRPTVQLLAQYGQTTGEPVSALVAILRIVSASSLSLAADDIAQSGVSKVYAEGVVADKLTHALVEYRENNSSAASYVSILCTLLVSDADLLEQSVVWLLVSLSKENRQLGEILSPSGSSQQLEAAVVELAPWVWVSYLRFVMEMFETLVDNSKSSYFQRRLWCLALLSAFDEPRLRRRGSDVQRTLLFDLLPQVLLLVDGSGLLELEVGARKSQGDGAGAGAAASATPYHQSLFEPGSKPLLSLCHVSLIPGYSVEDLCDDDDEIVAREYGRGGGGGGFGESDTEDCDMDGWSAAQASASASAPGPARAALYPSLVHMYADTLIQSIVMKTELGGMMKSRIQEAIRFCDQSNPSQPGLFQQSLANMLGSNEMLDKFS